MYIGFDLHIDENAQIFNMFYDYEDLINIGKKHLNKQRAKYEEDLERYVTEKEIDGTEIQNEWFPQIEADIFISHSHADRELACALAGWIYNEFRLKCFIDSNVWGYSEKLLDSMNSDLSNKRQNGENSYLYDYESCNLVSQHVNTMLSIALQKMIDKMEVVIFLNTAHSVIVHSDTKMEKTYSPWIYSEIICSQIIRKKPLLAYRNYEISNTQKTFDALFESAQFIMHSAISYTVSLKHFIKIDESELIKWSENYCVDGEDFDYALDILYDLVCPGEVQKTRELFEVLKLEEKEALKQSYAG